MIIYQISKISKFDPKPQVTFKLKVLIVEMQIKCGGPSSIYINKSETTRVFKTQQSVNAEKDIYLLLEKWHTHIIVDIIIIHQCLSYNDTIIHLINSQLIHDNSEPPIPIYGGHQGGE